MGEKGQSLVEFAISFLVVALLLAGAVEFGIAFFQYIQLQDAAQEGAIFGSVCQDVSKIENRVRHSSSSPINLQDESVTVEVEFLDENDAVSSFAKVSGAVRVTAVYIHEIFMPFFAGNEIRLKASVTDTIIAEGKCQ